MWLKPLIVVVFIALLISLGSGLVFLFKDQGATRRTWNSLSVRLGLALLLMGLIVYGTYTGQLRSHAPWDEQPAAKAKQVPQPAPAQP